MYQTALTGRRQSRKVVGDTAPDDKRGHPCLYDISTFAALELRDNLLEQQSDTKT